MWFWGSLEKHRYLCYETADWAFVPIPQLHGLVCPALKLHWHWALRQRQSKLWETDGKHKYTNQAFCRTLRIWHVKKQNGNAVWLQVLFHCSFPIPLLFKEKLVGIPDWSEPEILYCTLGLKRCAVHSMFATLFVSLFCFRINCSKMISAPILKSHACVLFSFS